MRALGTVRHAPSCRAGSSLVELVVSLALFAVVGAAVLRALDRQARFHDGILRILETRAQLGATHDMVAAELRGVSAVAGDVERVADSAIVYRQAVGTGLVCRVSGTTVDLGPDVSAAGQTLARMRGAPQPGDTAWLFDEGSSLAAADDRWHPAELNAAARATGACVGTPFVDAVLDATRTSWRLTLGAGTPLPAGVRAGSIARLTRRARFALYRAGTGDWNLGWSEWNAGSGAWNVIQPVSGPFLAYSRPTPAASGVALSARDSLGLVLAAGMPLSGVAGLALTTRSATARAVRMDGVARGRHGDSLRSLIALRNRQ